MYYIGISRTFGNIGILSDDEDFEPIFVPVPISRTKGKRRLNYTQFRELLEPYAAIEINECQKKIIAKAVLELPLDQPTHYKASTTSIGFFEAERAILDYLGISVITIEPIRWKHPLFIGKYKKLSHKQASVEFGNDNWPQFLQNHQTDRDGLCLAYWLKENYLYKPK